MKVIVTLDATRESEGGKKIVELHTTLLPLTVK